VDVSIADSKYAVAGFRQGEFQNGVTQVTETSDGGSPGGNATTITTVRNVKVYGQGTMATISCGAGYRRDWGALDEDVFKPVCFDGHWRIFYWLPETEYSETPNQRDGSKLTIQIIDQTQLTIQMVSNSIDP
jgi:hypothetical protein